MGSGTTEKILWGLSLKHAPGSTIYIKAQFVLAAFSSVNPVAIAGRCAGAAEAASGRCGEGCRRDVPTGLKEFPFQSVAVEYPLCGELMNGSLATFFDPP